MRNAVAVSLLTFACSAGALAQVAGLGGISGSVRDATGSAVPGASVTLSNESKGIKRTMETTDAGVFAVPALVPSGGYALVVKKSGFSDYTVKDFEILVGQTLDFKVSLTVSGAATTVEVTSEAPMVEDSKTGVSAVVEKDQIDNLPINGRRVDSFVLLTPAVTNDGEFGLVAFRGMAGQNSFLTDGNDTTQSFYNENAGRTRISTQISQDAVQEFQVLSNGFSAEFGRALGGVINTVTRSGTNDIHGTAFWFFRNRTLNATDRYANGLNAPEWRHQAGGTVGGPIKKDKVFFFLNGEFVRRNFPGQNRIINTGFTDASGNNITGACPGTGANLPTQAQCDAAIAFVRRQMNVLVPRTVRSDMGFGKIDWRPVDRHSFSFSANVMHWDSPHGIQTQAVLTSGNMLGNNANSTVETRYGKASWTSIPTNSSVNEFRFGWFKDRLSDPGASDLFPKETGPLSITLNGSTIGAGDNYPRTQPNENRYQFVDNFSWTKGAHSARFGFDISTTSDYVDRLQRRYGSYAYSSLQNFARDFSGNTTGQKNYQTFQQGFGNPIMDIRTSDFAFYAQDVWKISRKLTLNYGLRYEYAKLPQPTTSNPDYPQTAKIHEPTKNFAPRLNLSYAFDDRTVLRAGYGVFYGRFSGALLQTLFFSNAKYQLNYTIFPTDAGSTVFPNILPSPAGSAGTLSIEFADKDFHSQYTQQGTVAVEHQFHRDIAVTASYMWNRGIGLFTVRDLNIGSLGSPITYSIQDAAGTQTGTFTTPTYRLANRVDSRYRSVFQLENGGQSWYNGLSLQVRKRFSHGFTGAVAYTWSHAIDSANMGGASDSLFLDLSRSTYNGDYSGDKGTSLLDQRHRVVINFLWRPKFTSSTSAFARYMVNGWELSSITTLATPKPAPATVTVSSAVTAGGALANTSTLNGFFGSTRVPFWPFNPLEIDTIHKVDARLQRDLPFTERIRARMSFEAFNVFNTISNTFISTQAYTSTAGVLRPTANMGIGTASQGFPDGTNARRMQVGLRLEF
jgi:outer membrane receptor protein involved in Fe transport